MISSSTLSLYELRLEGWKALTERLGPGGAMRFMLQYDPGQGNYSQERHEIFADLGIEELLRALPSTSPKQNAGAKPSSE